MRNNSSIFLSPKFYRNLVFPWLPKRKFSQKKYWTGWLLLFFIDCFLVLLVLMLMFVGIIIIFIIIIFFLDFTNPAILLLDFKHSSHLNQTFSIWKQLPSSSQV